MTVSMGAYSCVGEGCIIKRCSIGKYCSIANGVAINPWSHPTDWLSQHEFQYRDDSFTNPEYVNFSRLTRGPEMFKWVSIGNDVCIGINAVILGGVTIGDGAYIGAGAVVTKDVPDYAIVAGNPARMLRKRFSDETIKRLLAIKWWDLPLGDLSGLPFNDIEACLNILEAR